MASEFSDLLNRFDGLNVRGPRYTSYPTANLFSEGAWQDSYLQGLHTLKKPLALYVHVPFCSKVCYYCACNRIHTGNVAHAETYVDYLNRETSLLGSHTDASILVEQLHFGGGTPTFLNDQQLGRIFAQLSRSFRLSQSSDRDFSIEIDPRGLAPQRLGTLAGLGFNRLSVGVQDFDAQVQQAVNRLQSEQETAAVIDAARSAGFESINVDLIYGLPKQTLAGFQRTLTQVLALNPDRLSIYNYAHLPHRFKSQKQINAEDLPHADLKLELLSSAVALLEEAGYVYIGMDHFARRSDSLTSAMRKGTLQRNFMGYSSHGECQLLGLGVSAIGQTGSLYVQNLKDLPDYYARLDRHQFPLERGYRLNNDDQLRRYVIHALMCRFRLSLADFARLSGQSFSNYFCAELPRIQQFCDAQLLSMTGRELEVTRLGRYLIRNICMVFDRYLDQQSESFSKAI